MYPELSSDDIRRIDMRARTLRAKAVHETFKSAGQSLVAAVMGLFGRRSSLS